MFTVHIKHAVVLIVVCNSLCAQNFYDVHYDTMTVLCSHRPYCSLLPCWLCACTKFVTTPCHSVWWETVHWLLFPPSIFIHAQAFYKWSNISLSMQCIKQNAKHNTRRTAQRTRSFSPWSLALCLVRFIKIEVGVFSPCICGQANYNPHSSTASHPPWLPDILIAYWSEGVYFSPNVMLIVLMKSIRGMVWKFRLHRIAEVDKRMHEHWFAL